MRVKCYGSTSVSKTEGPGSTPGSRAKHTECWVSGLNQRFAKPSCPNRHHWFESSTLRQWHTSIRLVQTVRLTVTSRESPAQDLRALSSVGRAVALQASGRRFDPGRVHQNWPIGIWVLHLAVYQVKRVRVPYRSP